jgi:hypothetical protein
LIPVSQETAANRRREQVTPDKYVVDHGSVPCIVQKLRAAIFLLDGGRDAPGLASAPDVLDTDIGDVVYLVSCAGNAGTKVDIIEVHEVPFIETSDLLEHRPPYHEGRTRHPVPTDCVLPLVQLVPPAHAPLGPDRGKFSR